MDTVEDVENVSEKTTKNYEDYYAKAAKYKTVMPRSYGYECNGRYCPTRKYGLTSKIFGRRQGK